MNALRRGGGRLDYQGWSAQKTKILVHCVVSELITKEDNVSFSNSLSETAIHTVHRVNLHL